MTRQPEPLTVELLERFRAALQTAGAPLGHAIGPGLTDAELDDIERQLDLTLPPELRTLWSWGCPTAESRQRQDGQDVNAEFEFWPPHDAVRQTNHYRQWYQALPERIAFTGPPQDEYLLVRSNTDNKTSPVELVDIESSGSLKAAPSIGALIRFWTEQLEDGTYRFEDDDWHYPPGTVAFIRDSD